MNKTKKQKEKEAKPLIAVVPLYQIKDNQAILSVQFAPTIEGGVSHPSYESKIIELYRKNLRGKNVEDQLGSIEELKKEYKLPKYQKIVSLEKAKIEKKGFKKREKTPSKRLMPNNKRAG